MEPLSTQVILNLSGDFQSEQPAARMACGVSALPRVTGVAAGDRSERRGHLSFGETLVMLLPAPRWK